MLYLRFLKIQDGCNFSNFSAIYDVNMRDLFAPWPDFIFHRNHMIVRKNFVGSLCTFNRYFFQIKGKSDWIRAKVVTFLGAKLKV